ncbi:hypothetical protein GSI_11856 [Ganoderma sinense ZZ0214-1]|uniref:Uncharacterized protein n=1 Tax=Ganoderma sinense ZZ0214-1 TaxID=1077348 RepID=A0A2G8RX68_9APHY|nr:hypothetical protein GSI_11856 [Ganoderma sinense ZZ0214-1]
MSVIGTALNTTINSAGRPPFSSYRGYIEPPISRIMNNDAVTILQNYTPGMYSVMADIVMTTFLFGCLTVLSIVSVCHLFRRGIKQPSTVFMLGSVFVLYASTATDFAVKTTYVVEYGRSLNAAVAALEFTSPSSTDAALSQFGRRARTISYVTGALYTINITLGDIIVWWRVYVLWQKRTVMALGLVLIVAAFVLGTLATILYRVDITVQPLLSYGGIYGGMSALLSFVSNSIATTLIGRKAWGHRKILRQSPAALNVRWKATPTMKVLTLLVESGTLYSILFSAALITNIMLRFKSSLTPSAAEYASLTMKFFTGCFIPLLAIYPTLIIFIVALNRSEIDGTLANATPSEISTNMLPSMLFRRSSTAINRIDHFPCPPDPVFDDPVSEESDRLKEERPRPLQKPSGAGEANDVV